MSTFKFRNMKTTKSMLLIFTFAGLLIAVISLVLFHSTLIKREDKETGEASTLSNYVIADSKVTLSDQTSASLRLILTKGNYITNKPTGLVNGSSDHNYTGSYELQLVDNTDDILNTMDLNKDWNNTTVQFTDKFDIQFHDYNNDSCPDFTLGTYNSAGVMQYYLYTISENNSIKRICQTPIIEMSTDPSIVFDSDQAKPGRFLNYYYDPISGSRSHKLYKWNEATGYFVIDWVVTFD